MLSLNFKNVQHVKIYLPCNFEVNPITHFDLLCKLEKRGDEILKKSSPLKLLSQSQPNFAEMILGWSPFKIVSGDAVHQPTWPLLLQIEHMVKLQVNNIKNLTWGKNDQHSKIYLPCNFEVNLITHFGVITLFSSNL